MRVYVVFIFIIIFGFGACNEKNMIQKVDYKNLYTLEVPISMKKSKTLNSLATIQLADTPNELYVIVLEESKKEVFELLVDFPDTIQDNFKLYTDLTFSNLVESGHPLTDVSLSDTIINANKAKLASFVTTVSGLEIYYRFACIEGTNSYYQVLVWTLASKQKQNSDLMKQIVSSFKEVAK